MATSKMAQQKITLTIFYISIIVVGAFLYFYYYQSQDTKIYVFDVGQGSSSLIRTREGVDILIDGGPNGDLVTSLSRVMPIYDRHIDVVILTHPHYDHLRGLLEVIESYTVGRVYVSLSEYDSQTYREFLQKVNESIVTQPLRISIDDDTYLDIIYPDHSIRDIKNTNNASIVSRFVDDDFSVLFPGDAEQEEELKMVQKGIVIHSDILIAGHHGSRTSSSVSFLEAVSPKFVIISAGLDNSYGHPHIETLDNLQKLNIPFFETKNGTIQIVHAHGYQIIQ